MLISCYICYLGWLLTVPGDPDPATEAVRAADRDLPTILQAWLGGAGAGGARDFCPCHKIPHRMKEQLLEGHPVVEHLVKEHLVDDRLVERGWREGARLQRDRLLSDKDSKEQEDEEEDKDFYEDDDNDSFITTNTSEEDSDDTLENSESNDSGVGYS